MGIAGVGGYVVGTSKLLQLSPLVQYLFLPSFLPFTSSNIKNHSQEKKKYKTYGIGMSVSKGSGWETTGKKGQEIQKVKQIVTVVVSK